MLGTTLCFDGLDALVVFYVAERAPDRDEWKSYAEFLKARAERYGKVRLLVLAGAAGPDAVQRKQLMDSVTPAQLRTAVVSDSLVARGIVTAFRWYGLELDAFKVSALRDAYRYLGATAAEQEWVERTLRAMRDALSTPRAASR